MKNLFTRLILILTIFVSLVIICNSTFAYDNDYVHPQINEEVAKISYNLESTLKNLGYTNGIKDVLSIDTTKAIYRYFREGGKEEDNPFLRSNNHFHDPLKSWGNAGLKGTYMGISSIYWAQSQESWSNPGGWWSWNKARKAYYLGLTSAAKQTREQNLADTFRALGQVMHLIEDASVPAHVRNDIHVFPYTLGPIKLGTRQTYETWTKLYWKQLPYIGVPVDPAIFSKYVNDSTAPVPISALWDTNQYTGTNPEITRDLSMGLAEYTNANFFSEDTIFTDYPYPAKENTNAKVYEQMAKDGKLDQTKYIYGYTSESRLAAYSYLEKYVIALPYEISIPIKKWTYNLDPFVYADYAVQLIPRAVGYSAGLLNYFFRGDVNMIPDGDSGSGYVIVNNTDEDMNGTFELWYDNKNNERLKVSGWTLSINKKSSGTNRSTNVTFTPPTDMKEENKYLLVFQGKLGNEENAVVGKNVVAEKPIPAIVHATRGYYYGTYIGYGLEVNIGDKQYARAIYDDVVKTGERVVIEAVRFAEENPYIILLLSLHEQLSSGTGTYKVHKFTVNDDGIAYGGIVKELPYYKEEFPRSQDVKTYENNYENNCMSQESKTDITFVIETSIRTTYNYQDLYVSRDGIPTVFGTLVRYKEEIGYSSEITYQNIRKEWCYNGTPACPWAETSNTKSIYDIPSDPGIIYRQFDLYCNQAEEFSYGEAYDVYLMPGSYSGVKQTTWCDAYGRQYSSSYEISGRTDSGKYYCGARESQYKVIIDDIEGDAIGEGYTQIIPLSESGYGLLTSIYGLPTATGEVKLPDKTVPLDPGYNTNMRNILIHNMIFPGGYSIAVSELNKPREWWESKIIKSIAITPAEEFSCGTVSIFTNDKKDCFIISYGNYGGNLQNYSTDCNSRCQTISKGDSLYSMYHVFDITFYKKR